MKNVFKSIALFMIVALAVGIFSYQQADEATQKKINGWARTILGEYYMFDHFNTEDGMILRGLKGSTHTRIMTLDDDFEAGYLPYMNAGSGIGFDPVTGVITNTSPNINQTLSNVGSTYTLSNGGGSFTLPTGAIFLANTTVSQTAIVALLGGVRKVTITGVTGVLAGDRVFLTPVGSTPVGYALADVVATAANTLEVNFTAPALALGASFSIPCKVTVFR